MREARGNSSSSTRSCDQTLAALQCLDFVINNSNVKPKINGLGRVLLVYLGDIHHTYKYTYIDYIEYSCISTNAVLEKGFQRS